MNGSFPDTYFVDGGTLRPNTPSYVRRPADDELYEALMDREFCYILTPRQMGKSSLMIHTSQRLKERNIKTAVVDIQGIGTNKVREWYASLFSQIRRGLRLTVDIDEWMTKKSNLGFGQLFMDFMQDVVLAEIPDQVVIFLDEVDWMIKIDFRDDFFASIRSIYNARAQYPEFNRVSFVLLGVASPADLISEPTRTPFNIGHAIPLQELSLEDATPLQNGLEQVCPGEGKKILERIFYWTNGHPYLTQKLCKSIAETDKSGWSDSEVDDLVHRLFLAEESRKEANLKFIQERILGNEHYVELLKLYKHVRRSRIKESGQSITQNQLMLSGLLTSKNEYLEVRNRIYHTVFNDLWINKNTPKNWQRVALATMSSFIILLLAVLGYNYTVSLRLKTYQTDYIRGNPTEKITALANIYRLHYWFLSNTDIDATAAQAFYEFTPDSQTQLSLFSGYGFSDPVDQKHLVTVISKLYVTLANVDEDNDNTSLLQAMDHALQNIDQDISNGSKLKQELDKWVIGRTNYKRDNNAALTGYSDAISLNPSNQATLYERAKVYIALGQYENALKDLNAAIGAAEQSAPDIPPSSTPTNTPIPPSDTPAPRITDTPKPSNTPQASETHSAQTDNTPTIVAITPTLGETSTAIPLTPSPTVVSVQPSPIMPTPDKFESNFTTLNHVIVAVKAIVDGNPILQDMLLRSANSYSNLDFLASEYAQRTPTLAAKLTPFINSPTVNQLGYYSLVFSPGSNLLVTVNADKTVTLWDVSNPSAPLKLEFNLSEDIGGINSVAISPDGNFAAVTTDDGKITLIDLAKRVKLGIDVPNSNITFAVFSPDGLLIATGSGDGVVSILSLSINKNIINTREHNGEVLALAFSPDSRYLVTGGADGAAVVIDTNSGTELYRVLHDGPVRDVAFSPDGEHFISGSADNTARIWEVAKGEEVARMLHEDAVNAVAFSPDGQYVISGSADKTARVWETATGKEVARMTHDAGVNSVVFSPNGRYAVSESADETARVWEALTGREITPMNMTKAVFSPDGNYVVSTDPNGSIVAWDPLTGKEFSRFSATQQPTFTPSNNVLGGADKIAFFANSEIWLMNVDGSDLQQLTSDSAPKTDLQWLPDGNTIIFISGKAVKYFNISAGTVDTLATFPSEASVDAFQVSHDGKQVMIAMSNEIFVVPFGLDILNGFSKRSELLNMPGTCILPMPKTPAALRVQEARWSVDNKLVAWLFKGNDLNNPAIQLEQVSVYDISACRPELIDLKDTFPGTRFTPEGYSNRELPDFDWDGFNLFVFNTSTHNDGWGYMYIYNSETHKPTLIFPGECCYRDARFSPDGTYLLYEFQDQNQGPDAKAALYFVPVGELNTGTNLTPIPLPDGFLKDPREGAQSALRPAQ